MPRFFSSWDELYRVAHALQPVLADRLDKQGFVLLGWGYGGQTYWFTKQPVYTPADIKKLKLFTWAGDNTKTEWWKKNGYRPVVAADLDKTQFPDPKTLFTIQDLGGWSTVNKAFFDPTDGSISKIENSLCVSGG